MREKILNAAKKLFIKNGYNATTTGDIVKYSGSSKGTMYYHFKTKESLFMEIIKDEDNKWHEKWHEEEKLCKSNREKFIRYNELSVQSEFFYPLQAAILEFFSREDFLLENSDKIQDLEKRYIESYLEIFEAGNKNGEWTVENVELMSQIASAAVNGIITTSIYSDVKTKINMMNQFSEIFLKGIE